MMYSVLVSGLLIVTVMDSLQGYSFKIYNKRSKRQVAGKDTICVPQGTCTSQNPVSIDPRIQTDGEEVCGDGTVPCVGVAGGEQCGQRFVSKIKPEDGLATNGAFPWQAYIRNETDYTGSGVLIDKFHILTAAHKVDRVAPDKLTVFMGVNIPDQNTIGRAEKRLVQTITIHPNYDNRTLKNDIAVLRLRTPIELGYRLNVGTACLPTAGTSFVGQNCTVSGWGQTFFGANDAPTNAQKQVLVPVVDYNTCRDSMAKPNVLGAAVDTFLDQKDICAGGVASKDACTQDGGSPLVCQNDAGKFVVAGLVIWGKHCGMPNVYGVYAGVANYIEFIQDAIK